MFLGPVHRAYLEDARSVWPRRRIDFDFEGKNSQILKSFTQVRKIGKPTFVTKTIKPVRRVLGQFGTLFFRVFNCPKLSQNCPTPPPGVDSGKHALSVIEVALRRLAPSQGGAERTIPASLEPLPGGAAADSER